MSVWNLRGLFRWTSRWAKMNQAATQLRHARDALVVHGIRPDGYGQVADYSYLEAFIRAVIADELAKR